MKIIYHIHVYLCCVDTTYNYHHDSLLLHLITVNDWYVKIILPNNTSNTSFLIGRIGRHGLYDDNYIQNLHLLIV